MVTLGYEWSVIRGRRPYQWTIWVCNLSPFICAATIQWATSWFTPLVDLLRCPCSHPCNCDLKYIYHRCFLNQLSGKSHVIILRLYPRFITMYWFSKMAISFQFVSTLKHPNLRVQSSEPRSITFSTDIFLLGLRCLFAVDRSSHVCHPLRHPLQTWSLRGN